MKSIVSALTKNERGLAKDFHKFGTGENGSTFYVMDKAGESATPKIYQGLYMYDEENDTMIFQGEEE